MLCPLGGGHGGLNKCSVCSDVYWWMILVYLFNVVLPTGGMLLDLVGDALGHVVHDHRRTVVVIVVRKIGVL